MAQTYKTDDVVWLKLGDFPWWPARVVNPDEEPDMEADVMLERHTRDTLVRFFKTNDFGWAHAANKEEIILFKDNEPNGKTEAKNTELNRAITAARAYMGLEPESTPKKADKKRKREHDDDPVEEKKPKKLRKESDVKMKKPAAKKEEEKPAAVKKEPKKKDEKKEKKETKMEKPAATATVKKETKPVVAKPTELNDKEMDEQKVQLEEAKEKDNVAKMKEILNLLVGITITATQLQATKIGHIVNQLRKHKDSGIADVCKKLILQWKGLVQGNNAAPPASPIVSKDAKPKPKAEVIETSDSTPSDTSKTPEKLKVDTSIKQSATDPATPSTPSSQVNSTDLKDLITKNMPKGVAKEKLRAITLDKLAHAFLLVQGHELEKCVQLATEIEQALYDQYKNTSKYSSQFTNIRTHLTDTKHPEFRYRIYHGEVTPAILSVMKTVDMASSEHLEALKALDRERISERIMAEPTKVKTTMFKCPRCKGNECSYFEMQTRSADEPMTVFISCGTCGKNWKQ